MCCQMKPDKWRQNEQNCVERQQKGKIVLQAQIRIQQNNSNGRVRNAVCPHHLSSLATEIHCGLFLTAMSGLALNAIYVSPLSTFKATTVLQTKLNIIFY